MRTSARNSVAYLGPEGTYSYVAAKKIFGAKNTRHVDTITSVCDMVASGKARYGVIPVENSVGGTVQESIDALLSSKLKVVGSIILPIHHALLSRTKDLREIATVYSHPQALRQTQKWLAHNIPNAAIRVTGSTTEALSRNERSAAFIANISAAKQHGLFVLARRIEDSKYNNTEFYVISRTAAPDISKELRAKRTVLAVSTHDRPGVLRDILAEFADRDITLTKLHSRAVPGKKPDYLFFLEIGALPENANFKKALVALESLCRSIRVFGVV